MEQLQTKNPQAFQMINQAKNSGANPQQLIKQLVGNVNPQQMQQVLNQAKQMGVPDVILSQVQNIK